MPCSHWVYRAALRPAARQLALSAGAAAARLHAAFELKKASRVYLCPLDRAGDLPEIVFGPNRIAKLTAAELEELVDQPRLRRINPTFTFDADQFSEFTWLIIEETYLLDRTPAERGQIGYLIEPSNLYPPIEPHAGRFPERVEIALFAMLLAPWEDWKSFGFADWRCFKAPWVYEINDDLFVCPSPPPSPKSLSWTGPDVDDEEGIIFGTEQPMRWIVKNSVAELPDWLNDTRWMEVTRALESLLFKTPIAHFFVKAFLEDPMDEFLAHLITIEAALGHERGEGVTGRLARRKSTLLGAQDEGKVFKKLYDVRSRYVHGGEKMKAIPVDMRVAARRLARRVVNALVTAALKEPGPQSREAYLHGLSS